MPTRKQLIDLAHHRGIDSTQPTRALREQLGIPPEDVRTVSQLRDIARRMNLKGYSRLTKDNLVEFINKASTSPGVKRIVHNNVANTFTTYYIDAPFGTHDPLHFLQQERASIVENVAPLTKIWLALKIFFKGPRGERKEAVLSSLAQTIVNRLLPTR